MIISVCSRSSNQPKALDSLRKYWYHHREHLDLRICLDSSDIYSGHKQNIVNALTYLKEGDASYPEDEEVVIMCHDDVEIISDITALQEAARIAKLPNTGFVGVAGATLLRKNEGWWTSRNFNETRGFVFQGKDEFRKYPNYFGPIGQVVVLDGCFLMASLKTLRKIGLDKPDYLSSGWDFYDMHLTYTAHRMGLNNYVAPIIIRHESDGQMREGWYDARNQFNRKFYDELPCKINMVGTHGLPN